MEYWIVTVRGALDAACAELRELGCEPTVVGTDALQVQMDAATEERVTRSSLLSYRVLRSAGRADSLERVEALAPAFAPLMPEGLSFSVRADGPERQELQEGLGGAIKDTLGRTVNLKAPQVEVFVHDADGQYLCGVLAGGDLGRRHYKIITGAQSLAGPVASAVLRIAGWTPKHDVVVWPCATGELAIEAALRASGKSPRAYELQSHGAKTPSCVIVAADPKLSMVTSTQKNAKIAGVHEYLKFSRQDLDWLDTKHDERGVPFFVGQLPNLGLYPKFAKELFYQLDYILASGGTACFACVNDATVDAVEAEAARSERGYVPARSYIWSGQQAITVVTLTTVKARKVRKSAKDAGKDASSKGVSA